MTQRKCLEKRLLTFRSALCWNSGVALMGVKQFILKASGTPSWVLGLVDPFLSEICLQYIELGATAIWLRTEIKNIVRKTELTQMCTQTY